MSTKARDYPTFPSALFEPRLLPLRVVSQSASADCRQAGQPVGQEHLASLDMLPRTPFPWSIPATVSESSNCPEDVKELLSPDFSSSWVLPAIEIHCVDLDLDHIKIEPLFQTPKVRKVSPTKSKSPPSVSKVNGTEQDMTTAAVGSRISNAQIQPRWDERYAELVTYKRRFGDCCVPSQWVENPSLAQWTKRQVRFLLECP
jgi:Helicase associated domain